MAARDIASLSEGMSTLSTAEDTQLAIDQAEEFVAQVLRGAKTIDKQTVYNIAEVLTSFWKSDESSVVLAAMSGFQRRIAHKIADLDELEHVVDATGKRVVYVKRPNSKDSGRLAVILAKHKTHVAQPQTKLKLMKRRPSHETSAAAAQQQRQANGSQRERTLSQREQEYEQARAAIFESQQAEAAALEASRQQSQSASETATQKGGRRGPKPSADASQDIPRDLWGLPQEPSPAGPAMYGGSGVWGMAPGPWNQTPPLGVSEAPTAPATSTSSTAPATSTPSMFNPNAEGFVPTHPSIHSGYTPGATPAPAPAPNQPPSHQQNQGYSPWQHPPAGFDPHMMAHMYPGSYGMPMHAPPPGMYPGGYPPMRPPVALRQRKLYDPSRS
eukprot:m.46346 g.46346  ORF g.46346 m.46346 type:complete len:386 (-) comp13141_c0_seq1:122-1279(-)